MLATLHCSWILHERGDTAGPDAVHSVGSSILGKGFCSSAGWKEKGFSTPAAAVVSASLPAAAAEGPLEAFLPVVCPCLHCCCLLLLHPPVAAAALLAGGH